MTHDGDRGAGGESPPAPYPLRVDLVAPDEAAAGAPVAFVVRATSTADRPFDLPLRGRDVTVDVLVETADGRPVWRLLEGAVVPAVVRIVPLGPGQTIERDATWGGGPAGEYAVRACLLTDELEPAWTPPRPLRVGQAR